MKTVLWLDDDFTTVSVIKTKSIDNKFFDFHYFNNIASLIDFLLCYMKDAESSIVNNLIFVLDVNLKGHEYIFCPKSWFGDHERYFKTNKGYDAGLVFYEKMVACDTLNCAPVIYPMPPVVFLSVMSSEAGFQERVEFLKVLYAQSHKQSIEFSKVKWMTKWDVDESFSWLL
jgi:hypothetical protein